MFKQVDANSSLKFTIEMEVCEYCPEQEMEIIGAEDEEMESDEDVM
jgi:hypothetical protein